MKSDQTIFYITFSPWTLARFFFLELKIIQNEFFLIQNEIFLIQNEIFLIQIV